MTKADLLQIVNLENEIFSDPWALNVFEEQLSEDGWKGAVAEYDDNIIGYVCYCIVNNEVHLTNIAVDVEYRRKSVAKQLLENIFKVATDKECEFILLEVRISNNDAIAFYKKYNFDILYRQPNYYHKPVEDAFVMVRYLDDKNMN